MFLSLAHACGLVAPLFPRAERREVKRRVKELTSEERMGREVSAAVAEVQAAAARQVRATSAVFVGWRRGRLWRRGRRRRRRLPNLRCRLLPSR